MTLARDLGRHRLVPRNSRVNVPVPCDIERSSIGVAGQLELGHLGPDSVRPLPAGSVPDRPRRPDRSPITAPTYSSETST